MSDSSKLSRRERQIMDILFARGEATVNQIAEALPDPPTPMAVRRMMHILEEKGHLRRRAPYGLASRHAGTAAPADPRRHAAWLARTARMGRGETC